MLPLGLNHFATRVGIRVEFSVAVRVMHHFATRLKLMLRLGYFVTKDNELHSLYFLDSNQVLRA